MSPNVELEMEIKFVYFDLGNILVSFDPRIACRNLASAFGVDDERADAAVYASGLQDEYEHGRVSGAQYASEVRRQLSDGATAEVSDHEILDAISAMFTPVESMRNAIDAVRRSSAGVGILSNTCEAHWDWIARQDYKVMEGAFDVQLLSCRVGSMKPDAAIYRAAESAAQVTPASILFLDDKSENVAAAIDRGWQAAQCFGGDEAISVLGRYGFVCQ